MPVIQKTLDGKRLFFLANSSAENKEVSLELSGKISLQVWNPHTGAIEEMPAGVSHNGNKTRINRSIGAYHSLFLVEK